MPGASAAHASSGGEEARDPTAVQVPAALQQVRAAGRHSATARRRPPGKELRASAGHGGGREPLPPQECARWATERRSRRATNWAAQVVDRQEVGAAARRNWPRIAVGPSTRAPNTPASDGGDAVAAGRRWRSRRAASAFAIQVRGDAARRDERQQEQGQAIVGEADTPYPEVHGELGSRRAKHLGEDLRCQALMCSLWCSSSVQRSPFEPRLPALGNDRTQRTRSRK